MKQVTRKALSLLLSFAMLLSMAQGICTAPAFAATPVRIGGVTVDSGDWYAQTDSSGTVTACESTDGWNIHVVEDDSGDTPTATITLKNAVIDNSSSNDAISAAGYDLKIELEGTANQIGTGAEITNGTAIYSDTGNSVAITGEGNLALKGRYGIYVQGSGNVTIDVSGSLSIKSLWQMVSANGNLAAKAKSISMDGYYIYCSNGGACLTANDGDLTVNGTDDYGISATGNIELEAPSGAVSVTGGHYSNITTGGTLGISISARDDVTLTGTVKGPPVSVASETGNVTVNGYYAAIEGATKSVTVSAPMGDVTLKSDSNSNIISGSSSYPLAITAGGALDAEGPYGIEGYGSAVLKAKSVRVALTDNGYGFRGDSLTITNPEGGNCSEVSVSGGGGGRNAIDAFGDVTVKADQVMIAAAADAAHAVYDGGGSITIGDAGLIVGAVTGDPISIAKGVVQASQNGGDKSGGLDLETTPPTMTTYYTAGNGYALFTPATADPAAPAKLTLHNATIHNLNPSHGNIASDFGIALPDGTITIQAEGTNTVIANYTSDIAGSDTDVTLSGGGILNVDEIDLVSSAENLNSFTKDPGTTLNGIVESYSATEGSDPGVTTVYGNVTANRDDHVVWTLPGIATVDSGATLTIPANKVIEFSNSLTNNGTIVNNGTLQLYGDSITNNHSIVNNGEIWMPYNTTVEQIKALNLTGAGSVMINDEGGDSVEKVYADGAIYAYGDDVTGDFNLTAPPTEATYYKAGNGYFIFTPASDNTPASLTLHNVEFYDSLTLPDTSMTLSLEGKNEVDEIFASSTVTVSGSGSLDVYLFHNSDSAAKLTVNSGAALNAWYQTVDNNGVTTNTIYGNYTANDGYGFAVHPDEKLVLAPGAVLTLTQGNALEFSDDALLSDMILGTGASIVNNYYVTLPMGTTPEQIAALPLSGTGVIRVITDDAGDQYDTYTNDGTALKTVSGGLDLTDGEPSGAMLETDGYTWTGNGTDGYTLTLGSAYVDGSLTLPTNVPVTIVTKTQSFIDGGISFSGDYGDQLTFKGGALLTVGSLNANGSPEDSVTVDGTKLQVNDEINIYGSGNDGSKEIFQLINGASVNCGGGVFCSTILIKGKSRLTADSDSCAVKAEANGEDGNGGNVTVTGGSTLTTGCEYGVYIIGGKLTVDGTSKLITNGSAAPFCVVDKTGGKAQSDVLSLPSLPGGMKIASATGSTDGYGYTYWSLVSTGGTLSATDENSEPATLTGAATGTLTFAKSNSNNNDGRNGSGSSGSTDKTVPTSVTDPSSGASADLSGATFPSGITTLTLSVVRLTPAGYPVSPLTPCSFPDLDGIAAYQAAVANQGLNIIGDPVPYRVSLTDQNGNTVQPVSGIVKIKMPLPTGLRGTPRIFHYGSDGTLTDFGAEVQNGYLIYAAACLGSFIVGGTGDSITLDTTSYTMPENGSYQIGARVTGSKAAVVKVHSTNDNTATVTKLTNGNYQVNGKNPGMAYIMFDVYDNKNHLLTHASVRVDVKTGVRPHGDSTRQYGIF